MSVLRDPSGVSNSRMGRRDLARDRAAAAREALAECRLCAHDCAVDRLHGERGRCGAGSVAHVFSAQVELSDELEFIPTFAVALNGCDLRCAFCITGAQSWYPSGGLALNPALVAEHASAAMGRGAKSVMILGGEPTIHLPAALEIVSYLPETVRLIWKTNGHGSTVARELLEGIFDVWLVDYKFGNDACAERLSLTRDYTEVVQGNLLWADRDTTLVIRHLLMPGHLECCWRPIAHWIAEHLPHVRVNLRAGFWPAWKSGKHPELRQPVSSPEIDEAWRIARELQLHLIE